MQRPLVRATEIGEYIRHGSCERRFKLDHNNRKLTKDLPFFYTLSGSMDPVLAEAGKEREREWENAVRAAGLADLSRYDARPNEKETPWQLFASRAADLREGQQAYAREVAVVGEIGGFRVAGRMDFVLILWRNGRPQLRIVECKASRKDRTYHRVQLVLYRLLVRHLLEADALRIGGIRLRADEIECVVARIDETTGAVHDLFTLASLDLDMEEADALTLLAPNGPLARILATPVGELPYQLDSRCDDCALNVYCLPEAARRRDIELLGVDPSTVRALKAAGVGNLDALAELVPNGPQALQIRADAGFTENLDMLRQQARARRRTLPGGDLDPDDHEVIALHNAGNGQLPVHTHNGQQLVRIFLSIHFDYVENRVGALAAHVTRSERPLSTLFQADGNGGYRPDPDVREQWEAGQDAQGQKIWAEQPIQGGDFAEIMEMAWSGDYLEDTQRERELLHRFFDRLHRAIRRVVAPEITAPLHLYVWSKQEMTRLMEACLRCDTGLLSHMRELLGCRESLEQLIYSVLQEEVAGRYALGWTGRGLTVVTSLKWFGRRFHWNRMVTGENVALDKLFAADLFDWKTTLKYDANGGWKSLDDLTAERHAFEVRACFMNSLSAPYWRALWKTLPAPSHYADNPKMAEAIRRYQAAGTLERLRAYLKARTQALRWVEESVRIKNADIVKPPMTIRDLPDFSLGVDNAAHAALDFLYLEQHVKTNDWIAAHLVPPANRVTEGTTIPVRNVRAIGPNRITARIELTGFAIDRDTLALRCSYGVGSFVRLSPCADNPHRGQTVGQLLRGGSTCTITALDWRTGRIDLSVIPNKTADRFLLASVAWQEGDRTYPHATLDDSPSDYTGGKIEQRLQSGLGSYVYRWFDPRNAAIPAQSSLPHTQMAVYRRLLDILQIGPNRLAPDQCRAACDGLNARVQLLQGPPGTGKTQTTAAAVLLRILARRAPGDVVLVAANTHTAVDTLLQRLESVLPAFQAAGGSVSETLPPVRFAKAHSGTPDAPTGNAILDFITYNCATLINQERQGRVLIIGGTPGTLLKLARTLGDRSPFSGLPHRFQTPLLVVDEASMMVLPYFLALASLVTEQGEILLAGDHRQLAPIIQHDWIHEDRPPTVIYQPFVSAYEAVRNLKNTLELPDPAILNSALTYTFRLPPAVRDLIARLYRQDAIELEGAPAVPALPCLPSENCWERVWQNDSGLFLVVHNERASKSANATEADIIARILQAGGELAPHSIGLVMPHRAQRSLLTGNLEAYTQAVDVIDTVERLQGGERETIIVSATASDPAAIHARADFELSVNRANVAFSRAKKRLIVVVSETLLSHIPAEVELYAASLLWKSLRSLCTETIDRAQSGPHSVEIRTLPTAFATLPTYEIGASASSLSQKREASEAPQTTAFSV